MQNDEQQIRELVSTWMDASKRGDTETVLSLMTDDVVFLIAGQPAMMGKQAFAEASRGQANQPRPQFDGTSEIHEIQVLGDWAYMWTRLTVVVTFPGNGSTMTRAGHTMSILRKENGRWLMARDANMLALVPAKS